MDPQSNDPLIDSSLEREIEGALAVDPSPEFLARVRRRVADEPAPHAWGSAWKLAGAGAIVATVAVVGVVLTWQQREPAVVSSVGSLVTSGPIVEPRPEGAPVVDVRPAPAVPVPVAQPTRDRVARARAARQVETVARRVEPEVLISPQEAAALRRLFADISERRVEPSVLPDGAAAPTSLMPIREITIEPIAVKALTPIGSV